MNPRIELVSEKEVRIQLNSGCADTTLVNRGTFMDLMPVGIGAAIDAEGRSALIDALNCLRDTGSFAALSDTSEVPYTGKEIWADVGNKYIACGRILGKAGDSWHFSYDGGYHAHVTNERLGPLTPPKPRVRPYTPEEAVEHLGRRFKMPCGALFYVNGVGKFGVNPQGSMGGCVYDKFIDCTWADTGEPCGIKEE